MTYHHSNLRMWLYAPGPFEKRPETGFSNFYDVFVENYKTTVVTAETSHTELRMDGVFKNTRSAYVLTKVQTTGREYPPLPTLAWMPP